MNKKYLICLDCGNVQVRTDINKIINNKYILLSSKYYCPNCDTNTKQVATNNIKVLKKSLVDSTNNLDNQLSFLLGR